MDYKNCNVDLSCQTSICNICSIDFAQAVESHIEWRDKLKTILTENNPEQYLANAPHCTQCALGCWLQGTGQLKFEQLRAFQQLRDAHREFHECVEEIISNFKSGDKAYAQALFQNEFAQATRRILATITDLHETISSLRTD